MINSGGKLGITSEWGQPRYWECSNVPARCASPCEFHPILKRLDSTPIAGFAWLEGVRLPTIETIRDARFGQMGPR